MILFGYFLHKLLAHVFKLKCSQWLATTVPNMLVSRCDSELIEITSCPFSRGTNMLSRIAAT